VRNIIDKNVERGRVLGHGHVVAVPLDLLKAVDQRLQLLGVADELHDGLPLAAARPEIAQIDVEVGHARAAVGGGGLDVAHNAPLDVGDVREAVAQLQLAKD